MYWPPMALAVAVTLAWPLLPMVTGLVVLRLAEAPLAGAEKVTIPPATGSRGLLAVTMTAKGLAKGELTGVPCGVLPVTGVKVNPWLSKAPMSTVPLTTRGKPAPRWSVVSGLPLASTASALLPASMAGLPGSRAMVCVGPPLSASGPSNGFIGSAVVPMRLLESSLGEISGIPEPSPMRLYALVGST